jgi:hypothetical protein
MTDSNWGLIKAATDLANYSLEAGRLAGIKAAGGIAHSVMDRLQGEQMENAMRNGDPYALEAKIETAKEIVDAISRYLSSFEKDTPNDRR